MPKYKKIKINVKKDTIDRLIEAYLSGYAPSRRTAAEECSVSVMTSGKVASALVDSGFMTERVFTKKGESSCSHLFCRENASIMIADISSSTFKMTIMNSSGETKYESHYYYDSSVSRAENLNIFLSRHGTNAISSRRGFCSIAVIYADEKALSYLENEEMSAVLPPISSKAYVSDAIYQVFGKRPAAHFTVSQAICEALKFKLHGDTVLTNGISYIFIGSHLSLFHIFPNGSVNICAPQNLLDESDRKLLRRSILHKNDVDRILVKLADFMGAAFSPSSILLESDMFAPSDETIEIIAKRFALSGLKVPLIYFKNTAYPLCNLGAVRSTLCTIIKRYVISK